MDTICYQEITMWPWMRKLLNDFRLWVLKGSEEGEEFWYLTESDDGSAESLFPSGAYEGAPHHSNLTIMFGSVRRCGSQVRHSAGTSLGIRCYNLRPSTQPAFKQPINSSWFPYVKEKAGVVELFHHPCGLVLHCREVALDWLHFLLEASGCLPLETFDLSLCGARVYFKLFRFLSL